MANQSRYVTQTTDVSAVEKELNDKFKKNLDLNVRDMQVFVEVTTDSYYPMRFAVDKDNNITIEDKEDAVYKNIYVGSNRQYLYKRFKINTTGIKLELGEYFKTAWNKDKFIVFKNGYLLNSSLYRITIPNLDNFYKSKTMYCMSKFKPNDVIDIFYIENDDNFSPVPFNRDMYICTRKKFAEQNNQVLFKVPYPYASYPRGKKMFFVLDQNGLYLDNRYDYTVSEDAEHIVLRQEHKVVASYVDYITFAFPYVRAGFEEEGSNEDEFHAGNASGIDFEYSFSILNPNNATNGIVHFYPIFGNYKLQKRNFILFGNSAFIDPDRYEIIDNGTIRFLAQPDIRHSAVAKYTMCIFKEQRIYDEKNTEFQLEVHQVVATEERQKIFNIPKVDNQKSSFLAFVGSMSLDEHDRFEWKQELGQLVLAESADYVARGRAVTFIFYTPRQNQLIRDKEIIFKKMEFDVIQNGKVAIPSKLHNDINFNPTNLILFLNGTYLQPDRYIIDKSNTIMMIDPIDDALKNTKTMTGIYLVSYTPSYETEGEGPYKNIDLKEDHDWIWYDEMYAIAKDEKGYIGGGVSSY